MYIIRLLDCPPSTWKNGGGSTRQLLAFPPGASLDNFIYRISVAEVDSDGPFSHFPGIDRSLAILDGDGLALMNGAQLFGTLLAGQPPMAFDGALSLSGLRLGGKVRDFNVMSRRGQASHRCQQLELDAGSHRLTLPARSLLFVAAGQVQCGEQTLHAQEAGWQDTATELTLHCDGGATLLLASFTLTDGGDE